MAANDFFGMVGHLGRLHHRVGVAAVDLYADRSLVIVGQQLGVSFLRVADKTLGGNELRVHHVGTLLPAYSPEGRVSHILHRRQQHRSFSQLYAPYLHFN